MIKTIKFFWIVCVIPFLLTGGCQDKYTVEPESLPVAYVGQTYTQQLKITGGKVSEQHFELTSNIREIRELKLLP